MKHSGHDRFVEAIQKLALVRQSFTALAKDGLILGNDNHIGDIGEYWVRRYYEGLGKFKCFGTDKNAPFDIQLRDETKVSVKTLTAWCKTGYGTQVRPLDGKNWTLLAAVYLSEDLFPERIAIVPLTDLLRQSVFVGNAQRRAHPEKDKATSAYPRFQWWHWLEAYKKRFNVVGSDLIPVEN